ncbi:PilZ domain-containing protein [Oceanisphaera psychrotolerans]|uniref:Pilus assembly protein PilZ n=1 Tax=Oceanisphaera psychrotolerans TaxID=1414654 RepID=A0A1J4Q9N5_9GAMM|nr:PilZ domain-containing protein [Oceanisphaera psychrotolerans]OIN03832.1 pilus assembly protein PilZ [Oceanisphaera psychrotolerans]
MIPAHEEQRLFSRMQLNARIILATTSARVEGICRNLSAEGVLMEVAAGQCQLGQEWRLVLPSVDAGVEPLMAVATVIRVDTGDRTDMVALALSEVC